MIREFNTPALTEGHAAQPLHKFLMERVLPNLDKLGGSDELSLYEFLTSATEERDQQSPTPQVINSAADTMREEYNNLLEYDPLSDNGEDFYYKVILGLVLLTASSTENDSSLEGLEEVFIEKVRQFAQVLYRAAFFRNSYDTLDAWQSCVMFQNYQKLFEELDVLPEEAKSRITEMSPTLDAIWSDPDIVKQFDNEQADRLVEGDTFGRESAAAHIYRAAGEDPEVIPIEDYPELHKLRPDLFPEDYEEYLKELRRTKSHTYALGL